MLLEVALYRRVACERAGWPHVEGRLPGRWRDSGALVEAAGRLEVRVRSVQTALAALGASEDSRGWRIPELTTMDLGVA